MFAVSFSHPCCHTPVTQTFLRSAHRSPTSAATATAVTSDQGAITRETSLELRFREKGGGGPAHSTGCTSSRRPAYSLLLGARGA